MSWANVPKRIFWWLWRRCPPLPIPNREVKPVIADDTAHVRGKVGRCQFFTEGVLEKGLPFFVFIDWIDAIDTIEMIEIGDNYFLLFFIFFVSLHFK